MEPIRSKEVDVESLQDLILRWNIDFPIDRWWRKLHDVSFNSERHREISFIDMFIEWQEEIMFEELSQLDKQERYIPSTGNYLKDLKPEVQSLSDEAFNKIDF